ncbi:MAG TPA: FAD-dependent oxidoreductase [Tepidisphaeraceae bacterium]
MAAAIRTFDVIGVGSMGAAACYHLARRDVRVLGLERFDLPHGMGSYHSQSRMIRQAYFEHPDYVPRLRHSYVLWDELSAELGRDVIHVTGGLMTGPAGAAVVEGSLRSVREHALPHDLLEAAEAMRRFPQFVIPEDYRVLHDHRAGLVLPERAVAGHAVRRMLRDHMPHADGPLLSIHVCMYTNCPDHHFIIERHPHYRNVFLACDFSGHGFKFATVIGGTLAELATAGRSSLSIKFLGLGRFN